MLDDLTAPKDETAGALHAPAVIPLPPPGPDARLRTRTQGIAIVGSNPVTKMAAPFADPAWRIYGCSASNSPYGLEKHACILPRVDEWFELHAPIEDATRPFGYLQYVSTLPKVWMRDERALASGLFPGAQLYPDKELRGTDAKRKGTKQIGPGVRQDVELAMPVGDGLFCPYMFSSSIAYILAKAIVDCEREGIPAIGLWGILQSCDNEYAYQRPGTQYFLWEAARRGIKVLVAPESRLAERPPDNW